MHPRSPNDPRRLAHYRIVGRLGVGGMGTVYAALDAKNRPTAVKVVHSSLAVAEDFRTRFGREVELLAHLRVPGLPEFRDADPGASRPWIATEYVPGPTLTGEIRAHGPLPRDALFGLAAGTARVLELLHERGVVHRDIKPDNIILGPGGPVVLDMGIARTLGETALTRTGGLAGTPGWIAPELYEGDEPQPEADVFSWGAVVAFGASGIAPFGADDLETAAFRVLRGTPDLVGLPPQLQELIETALARSSTARPTAAQAVAGTIAGWTTDVPDTSPDGSPGAAEALSAESLLAARWPADLAQAADIAQWRRIALRSRLTSRARWWTWATAATLAIVVGAVTAVLTVPSDTPAPADAGEDEADPDPLPDLSHGGADLTGEDSVRDLADFSVLISELHEFSVMTQDEGAQSEHADLTVNLNGARTADGGGHELDIEATYNRDTGSYVLHSGDFSRQFRIPEDWEEHGDPRDRPELAGEPPESILRWEVDQPEVLAVLTPEEPGFEFTLLFPDAPEWGALVYQVPPEGLWGHGPEDSTEWSDDESDDPRADGSESMLTAVLCIESPGGYPWDGNALRWCTS